MFLSIICNLYVPPLALQEDAVKKTQTDREFLPETAQWGTRQKQFHMKTAPWWRMGEPGAHSCCLVAIGSLSHQQQQRQPGWLPRCRYMAIWIALSATVIM